jgi:hypothetical protein
MSDDGAVDPVRLDERRAYALYQVLRLTKVIIPSTLSRLYKALAAVAARSLS